MKDKEISKLLRTYRNGRLPSMVWGAVDALKAPLISILAGDGPAVIIVPEGSAETVKRLIYPFFTDKIRIFPSKDYVFADIETLTKDEIFDRLCAIEAIRSESGIVITTAEAAMQFTAPESYFDECSKTLETGSVIDFESLSALLSKGGYKRVQRVDGKGQYAKRGDLFDIWSPLYSEPARIEFFDDEIEKISAFDPFSQLKKAVLNEYKIIPASEFEFDEKTAKKLVNALKIQNNKSVGNNYAAEAIEKAENGILPDAPDCLTPVLFEDKSTLFDYIGDGCGLFVFEHRAVFENARVFAKMTAETLLMLSEKGRTVKGDYYLAADGFISMLSKCKALILDMLSDGISEFDIKELISLSATESSAWHGNLDILAEDVEFYAEKGYKTVVCSANPLNTEKICERLKKAVEDRSVTAFESFPDELQGGVSVAVDPLVSGFIINSVSLAVFSDRKEVKNGAKKPVKRLKNSREITSLEMLKKGDLVVHNDYGIGVFDSIVSRDENGVTRDLLRIKYAGNDILYVPCDRLDLIAKYTGADVASGKIKLSKIGGAEWQNTKNKVRAAVRQLAFDLTALYAERMKTPGHAFTSDTIWQKEFEDDFEYTETDDQARVSEEVKRDMERPVAMDRLICGDVGVGKTEVAMRAVFKCVSDGKQAAVLVPTTVLAWQHYRTFLSRFSDYPVKIEMLSRFVPEAERKKVVKRLKSGETDIVIGTHSLLQKNVVFKDLGLLVVDEEQRFGVGHKETLKEKYKDVDCITLSATPIPRTLNMALSGIRDMSVIEDYPEDRRPITTYLAEYDEALVVSAVEKELARGGQIYYLHNRVESIYRKAVRLSELFPSAKIDVAHGQMDEKSLSDAWDRLLKGETSILVCTTIIETGVDVPNVNTILIDDADNLGLAQLHQIRGRVGRSSRRAYCWLFYKKGSVLTDDAAKRLAAIREYTEFGAGLKIAIRDLEIRGAGSVLGANQHGHIANVGYDMYVKLLENAVCEQKGIKPKTECACELRINAFIPGDYIEDVEDRIVIYKKISAITDDVAADEIREEITDRFGPMPLEVENLIAVAELRAEASEAGIKTIKEDEGGISLIFEQNDFELFAKLCDNIGKNRLILRPAPTPRLVLYADPERKLKLLSDTVKLAVSYVS